MSLLRATEDDLLAKLRIVGATSDSRARELAPLLEQQLASVRHEIAATARGRRRAVDQLRAAEARAGHHHHHDCDRWARLGLRRDLGAKSGVVPNLGAKWRKTSATFVTAGPPGSQMGKWPLGAPPGRIHGASAITIASRRQGMRGRAIHAHRRWALSSPSAARRRHRPREFAVRRRAQALEEAIAGSRRRGEWSRMDPHARVLAQARLRWYQAGAPIGEEPDADVPLERWLPPDTAVPPLHGELLPGGAHSAACRGGAVQALQAFVTRPYGMCASSRPSVRLVRRAEALLTEPARPPQPSDTLDYFRHDLPRIDEESLRDDRYRLQLYLRENSIRTDAVDEHVKPGSVRLTPPHDTVPPEGELLYLEERLDDALWAWEELRECGISGFHADSVQSLHRRLTLWVRAVRELLHHHAPLGQLELPPLPPLDTRALDVLRDRRGVQQLWRHRELYESMLGSVDSLLDALERRSPVAADLVSRFWAWQQLPPFVAAPHVQHRREQEHPALLERRHGLEVLERRQHMERFDHQLREARARVRREPSSSDPAPTSAVTAIVETSGEIDVIGSLLAAGRAVIDWFRR